MAAVAAECSCCRSKPQRHDEHDVKKRRIKSTEEGVSYRFESFERPDLSLSICNGQLLFLSFRGIRRAVVVKTPGSLAYTFMPANSETLAMSSIWPS